MIPRPRIKRIFCCYFRLAIVGCAIFWLLQRETNPLVAQDTDWPQWRGPNRDGLAAPQKLLQSWNEGGPELVWTSRACQRGFSTPTVSKGELYLMGSDQNGCNVLSLKSDSGQSRWSTRVDRPNVEGDYIQGCGVGPRSSPTVSEDWIFALSELGKLSCLNRLDGKILWTRSLITDFGGAIPQYGFSESVLVDGDRLLCCPGGANYMVCLSKFSGEVVWKSNGFESPAHYSSILPMIVGDKKFYVTATKVGVIGFDSVTGKLSFVHPATGNAASVIPTPIVQGNRIYHSSSNGAGNALIEIATSEEAATVSELNHKTTKTMENDHGGSVRFDETVFGFSKTGGGTWIAQDFLSGEVLWKEKVGRNKSGSIVAGDSRLYCFGDKDGQCWLIEPSRSGWLPRGQLLLPEASSIDRGAGAIWTHPVIANGRLFLRDQELLFCFNIQGE
jgi:outer membrane protein assembly factor BamB